MTELETQILQAVASFGSYGRVNKAKLILNVDAHFTGIETCVTAMKLIGDDYLESCDGGISLTDKGRAALKGEGE